MVDGTPYESICKADLVIGWVTMNCQEWECVIR